MNKSQIRKEIKEKKQQLTQNQQTEYSEIIIDKLKKQQYFKEAKVIYSYVSFNEEVFTQSLIEYILREGIPLAVPKIVNKKMNFYYIYHTNELKHGYYGILEPVTNHLAKDKNVLMIMPGLAFDMAGNRIGYGAGYYDTYFEENKHLSFYKTALTYDFQVIGNIETESHDKKVDSIITEKRILHINKFERERGIL